MNRFPISYGLLIFRRRLFLLASVSFVVLNGNVFPRTQSTMPEFFAHTSATSPWEPLYTGCRRDADCRTCADCPASCGHLDKTAHLCGRFVAEMVGQNAGAVARSLGEACGYLHDAGKFSQDFQSYLRRANSAPDDNGGVGHVDHSTAGATHAAQMWRNNRITAFYANLLTYAIAGHHGGLPDGNFFEDRLIKDIPTWRDAFPPAALPPPPPSEPFLLRKTNLALARQNR